ncbi:MAG: hypothetical protein ACD_46C00318G0002 [uncultured bacterium]|nr:MAG: hypothetical protein ACD_46C00318G0002 [uncultured bacterium]
MQGRKINRTIPIYNQQEIDAWQSSVNSISGDILTRQLTLDAKQQEKLNQEQLLQQFITNDIRPIEDDINHITAQIDSLTLPNIIEETKTRITEIENQIKELEALQIKTSSSLQPFEQQIETLRLNIQLKEKQQDEINLNQQLSVYRQNISHDNSTLRQLHQQHSSYSAQIASLESELSSLTYQQEMDSVSHMFPRHHQHGHHHHDFVDTMHVFGDMNLSSRIYSIISQLEKLRSSRNTIDQEKHSLEHRLRIANENVGRLTAQLDRVQQRIITLNIDLRSQIDNRNIPTLQATIYQLQQQMQPFLTQQRETATSLNTRYTNRRVIQTNLSDYQKRLTQVNQNINSNESCDLTELEKKLQEKNITKRDLLNKQSQQQHEIEQTKIVIQNQKTSIQTLQNQLQALQSNQYMQHLINAPGDLFSSLANVIVQQFSDYDNANPANQHWKIRSVLADIQQKIYFIDTQPNQANLLPQAMARQKYYQLCGMLWQMLNFLDDEINLDFAEKIMGLLRTNPVAPDEAINQFETLHSQYPIQLNLMSQEALKKYELNCFENAKTNFTTALNSLRVDLQPDLLQVRETGFKLFNTVTEKQETAHKNRVNFDVKLHTTILNKSIELALDPTPEHQDHYKKLMLHTTDGQPSICKKILGIMGMFLGVALIGLSIAGKVSTFGLSTPLTILGVLGGFGLFCKGYSIFKKGCETGERKMMRDFVDSTKPRYPNVGFFPRSPVSQPPIDRGQIDENKNSFPVTPSAPPLFA